MHKNYEQDVLLLLWTLTEVMKQKIHEKLQHKTKPELQHEEALLPSVISPDLREQQFVLRDT